MRIRFLVFGLANASGGVRSVVNQANALADRHDVEIVSVFKRRKTLPFWLDPRVRRHTLLHRRKQPWKRLLLAVLARGRSRYASPADGRYAAYSLATDLLLRHYLSSLEGGVLITTRPSLNLISARFGPASVVRIGEDHMNYRSYRPDLAAAIRRWYPRLDALTVLTRRDAEDYRAALGPAARIEHIPNMVPAATRPPATLDQPVIVAAGRLTHQKGFDMLVDAFTPLARDHPDWQLRIFGDGPLRDKLAHRIENRGMTGRIRLMGPTSRFEDELRQAAFLVLSSRYEGLPMTILEAMTQGVPVVAFDCHTGPRDIITADHDGLLVPPKDTKALTRAMNTLVTDSTRRRILGANAYATATRYASANITTRWEKLIADLGAE